MSGLSFEKVIVPVDFSDESRSAIDTALEIAGNPNAIHVVHVLQELNAADPGVVWRTIDNESRSRHATDALLESLEGSKYDGVQIHMEIGDPGYRITHYAEEIGADLIVMPSHGRQGLSRMLIGSVAERVLRLAPCPVLVLRD